MRLVFHPKMSAAELTYLTVGCAHDVNVSMVFPLVLDTELRPEEIREELLELAATVPRFRQRIVRESPWAINWSAAEDVRVESHLTEIAVGEGGLDAAFAQLPALLDRPFDYGEPPWQALYFHGMPDGRSLLILRLHHCMGDGLTYVAAFRQAFGNPEAGLTAIEAAGGLGRAARALAEQVCRTTAAAGRAVAHALVPSGRAGLRDEFQIWSTPPPPGRMDRTRSGQRIAMWTVPTEDWARIARENGVRRNDLFVLIASYAESAYRDWPDGHSIAIMPISMRPNPDTGTEQDGSIALASGVVVLDRDDIRAGRLTRIGDATRAARDDALDSSYRPVVPELMQLLPGKLRRLLNLRLFSRSDLVASNVGGGERMHVGRAEVSVFTAVSPAVGCPVAFTLYTYADRVLLVSSIDPGIIADTGEMESAVEEALALFTAGATRLV
ncbi:hypothetical protein GCM10009854_44190 [Saccharopolyspora halophila]|uniref:diacylglycerol O-acyltransferase n=1 Tax=Saccharopolyspora halophila TaxID=405551 RepID=A0ABN3GSW9_9PSEU